jgi:predicted Fe-Mo cluster-binding NifX family protein
MRIAIPVKNLDSGRNLIAKSLDANGHLCLYDQMTNELRWLKISDLASNLAELFPALEKASVKEIVSPSLHPMALKVLKNRGFEVYRSQGSNLQYNLSLRKAERLMPFSMAELLAGASGCGSSCSSCETTCEAPEK